MDLIVLCNTAQSASTTEMRLVVDIAELRKWVIDGRYIKHLFKYSNVQVLTCRNDFVPKFFIIALLLKLMSRKQCLMMDDNGQVKLITARFLLQGLFRFIKDLKDRKPLLKKISAEVKALTASHIDSPPRKVVDFSYAPVYLRTDLWFGLPSGGSIGHISGVLNNLDKFGGCEPIFLTADIVPTIREGIETHIIRPEKRFWDFSELPTFYFNETCLRFARKLLKERQLSFVYQRYSLNNYAGLKLAKEYNVPLVLEYNGSEMWVGRNWGNPLKYEALTAQIEILNMQSADVIVVVSKPLRNELVNRGIDDSKILVNPNGVNPEKYNPSVDGAFIRKKYSLERMTVVGFIGTFGKWHGAEVLVKAFGALLRDCPAYRKSLRLLLIGDGVTMPLVKDALAEFDIADVCILTGLVPQEEGPAHLAACDILASPHVPNPDGTPFFGSPTKLFEYMAMGKAIIASDLDQIGEVLEHGRTALMVEPGDAEALARGMKKLVDNPELREKLGVAARQAALSKHTWLEHTRRIIDKLKERLSWG